MFGVKKLNHIQNINSQTLCAPFPPLGGNGKGGKRPTSPDTFDWIMKDEYVKNAFQRVLLQMLQNYSRQQAEHGLFVAVAKENKKIKCDEVVHLDT
jgi:hypothetical protein